MANQRLFTFPTTLPTWHLGHMAKAIRSMKVRMKELDVVIETRDARLPLTSINPVFEEIFKSTSNNNNNSKNSSSDSNMPVRLIVYNKRDLANQRLEKPLIDAFKQQGQTVFFTNSRVDEDVRQILRISKELAYSRILKRYGSAKPPPVERTFDESDSNQPKSTSKPKKSHSNPNKGMKIMFCGMPNVGKSSLLNALRRVGCHKGKAASEAPMPGHTRSIGGVIKISEGSKHTAGWPVYAFDTPGIMLPYLGHGEEAGDRAFKMAIAAIIKESLFDINDLSAYLLHTLVRNLSPMGAPSIISKALQISENNTFLIKACDPSQPLPTQELLCAISYRINAFKSGGVPNLEAAAQWMLKCFRDGKFGGCTLDDVGQEATSTTDHSTSQSHILSLIKSRSTVDPSIDLSTHEIEPFEDFSKVTGRVSNYIASNRSQPKSKTAIKLEAKKAKKQVQRTRQEQKRAKRA